MRSVWAHQLKVSMGNEVFKLITMQVAFQQLYQPLTATFFSVRSKDDRGGSCRARPLVGRDQYSSG
jgi:hypothetical protein